MNLTDPLFKGVNHKGKKIHENDFDLVLRRSFEAGVEKIIISGTSLQGSRDALEMSRSDLRLFSTVGCHPSHCLDFDKPEYGDPDSYLSNLLELAKKGKQENKVVAIGECGLDYAELNECPKEIQLKYFERQFEISQATGLPMFLHCREAGPDFVS